MDSRIVDRIFHPAGLRTGLLALVYRLSYPLQNSVFYLTLYSSSRIDLGQTTQSEQSLSILDLIDSKFSVITARSLVL